MTPIKALPDLEWTDQSAKEIALSPGLVEQSDFAWQVGDDFIAGWYYPVFMGPAYFWFALTKVFAGMKLRRLRELQPRLPTNAITYVEDGWEAGDRFARYFKFYPTEETRDVGDSTYRVYRRD